MWRQDWLEHPSARLLLACAVSLLAHALLILHLPIEPAAAPASAIPYKTKVSVAFRAPEVPSIPESKPAAQAPSLPSPVIERQDAPSPISEPTRQRLPVEDLRTAWRNDDSFERAQDAPMRLGDEPASDTEARAYLASWQREVQRVGKLNFPTDEQGRRLRGSLRLLVGIRFDGSLAYARVTTSSGKARLDAAAINIVELAAPFAPLPLSLRRGDVPLEIERTWRVGSSLVQP